MTARPKSPRPPSRRLALGCVMVVLVLQGCRARDNDPGPGGVTVGEARALDDAAKMLENRPRTQPVGEAIGQPSPAPQAADSPGPNQP